MLFCLFLLGFEKTSFFAKIFRKKHFMSFFFSLEMILNFLLRIIFKNMISKKLRLILLIIVKASNWIEIIFIRLIYLIRFKQESYLFHQMGKIRKKIVGEKLIVYYEPWMIKAAEQWTIPLYKDNHILFRQYNHIECNYRTKLVY